MDHVYRDTKASFVQDERPHDVINTKAGPLRSAPLEKQLMLSCQGVTNCAVFGMPRRLGDDEQVPVAVVILRQGVDADPVRLQARANTALTSAGLTPLVATYVATSEEFPIGLTGKALKRHLRQRLMTGPQPASRVLAVSHSTGRLTQKPHPLQEQGLGKVVF